MILYAYRFSYNFYGLISVSGFADVKISSLVVVKYLQHAYAGFTYAKYSYFIDFLFGDETRNTETHDENLKVCKKFKVR